MHNPVYPLDVGVKKYKILKNHNGFWNFIEVKNKMLLQKPQKFFLLFYTTTFFLGIAES